MAAVIGSAMRGVTASWVVRERSAIAIGGKEGKRPTGKRDDARDCAFYISRKPSPAQLVSAGLVCVRD